ncbi:acylphosphatase [Clostridium tyrobutyricum]|jgi:acylphosphatase|uniref:Acylphosphatase n=1 Tax=Clostridium tyrobutyricum DIVETGP TaxID=1408889 RepID=W6N841_CLOTY|nr:acylphosphatase [Clostridium tyrobutyricum]AND84884.1 acylphosphatase [Clostridium tyrobutyricum]ANP69458.1 acylphosphatase [Clostridium tyrobutyricum]MBV4416059.1 acylphosphatase [Clostridium tyrobutyricum]MBV4423368.1 acylphosphatase [Clostridium tyrobutyricum]MBV4425533.1 acylphosphatase [Clostridium tyrobutyricum]
MSRYHIVVCGKVQGVGFRYTANYLASKMNLTGWVKNMDNGNVSIELQGSSINPNTFIKDLEKANRFIKVDNLYYERINLIDLEKSFEIKY